MMMPDYPGGVTLFPAKNPRPGPDPGGGRSNNGAGPPGVYGGGGGGVGGGNTSLGHVQNDRSSCQQQHQQQQHPTYPGFHAKPPPSAATGRLQPLTFILIDGF